MVALAGLFVPFILLMLVLVVANASIRVLRQDERGVVKPFMDIAAKNSAPPLTNGSRLAALP